MILLVAGVLGALGVVCLLTRRSLLGVMVGMQLLVLGGTIAFVAASAPLSGAPAMRAQGHVFGFVVALGGIAQLALGYAFTLRLFYLRKNTSMDELSSLKH